MQARRYLLPIFVVVVLSIFSMTSVVSAQDQSTTCQALVSTALNQLSMNCANLERNTSCYGFPTVVHTSFAETVPDEFYTVPGDRSDLTITEAIQTGPLNLAEGTWGINVMNVDANLPSLLPGTGVVYIQTGGVEVENGVDPEEAVDLSGDGVNVTTASATDLLTWPAPGVSGHASETILSLPASTSLTADATDGGGFARVVYQNRTGWVSSSALSADADLSGLPVIGPNDMTPMQDFYYRVGINGAPPCEEAASLLFVQGPQDVSVDIMVFDKPVRIESTIILRTLPAGDQLGDRLEIVVLSGLAILNADTPEEIIVPPGYASSIRLADLFVSLGIEGDADEKATVGSWTQPRPLTQDELDEFAVVEDFPTNIVNYSVDVPVVVTPSGDALPSLVFANQESLEAAQAACISGELSGDVCEYLGLP